MQPEGGRRSASAHLPSSPHRFPDGAHYRFEVASVEGPACLEAAIAEAEHLDVFVHRYSQGSGVFLHTDEELDAMATTAARAAVEVSLFARPPAAWTASTAQVAGAAALASACAGVDGLRDALADVARAAEHGIRSVLAADLGLVAEIARLRAAGRLPSSLRIKTSVMLPIANPATARVLVRQGADTLNVAPYLTLAQIAEIRSAVDVPLDVYVEAPDTLGGLVRLHEIPELIRVAAPVHVKLGLRNAPDVYPAGGHLRDLTVRLTVERVRRVRLACELLARAGSEYVTSEPGAAGLAVPESSDREPMGGTAA